ncbi:MAG: DUF5690 family protein [Myxococcota bacterium]
MKRLTTRLAAAPPGAFAAYAVLAAFSAYFCMYAFRKPFAAGRYDGPGLFGSGVELKTALVIGQLLGYTLSKYLGIRVVSEARAATRGRWLVGLVAAAELSLVLFALLPRDAGPLALFLNGLPLGMVWGLVVAPLEGRRLSDLLLVGLSLSFIVASGVVKDVGRALMSAGVPEPWMPAATGALFFVPFVLATLALQALPPPSAADEAARLRRAPMDRAARWAFLRRFGPGLLPLFALYVLFTAYRDFRDNYGVELFQELGYAEEPALFTQTELPVALGVLVALAALNLVPGRRAGLVAAYAVMFAGTGLLAGATGLREAGVVSGAGWMVLTGLGSYLVYVPFNAVLFERLIAFVGVPATAVFAIYVADALGYTGSVALQLGKDLGASDATRLAFFDRFTGLAAAAGALGLAGSLAFFLRTGPAPGPERGSEPEPGQSSSPGD